MPHQFSIIKMSTKTIFKEDIQVTKQLLTIALIFDIVIAI